MNTGKYIDKDGGVRWKTDKQYTKEEKAQQREEFAKEAKCGTRLCLTDLMINHGIMRLLPRRLPSPS